MHALPNGTACRQLPCCSPGAAAPGRVHIFGRHHTSPGMLHPCRATLPSQVVLTPHVYPPSITMASFLGTSLWDQCRTSFGYLQTRGVCPTSGGACRVFPVLIGETGSNFQSDEDREWLSDFADFVNAEVMGAEQWAHAQMPAQSVLAGSKLGGATLSLCWPQGREDGPMQTACMPCTGPAQLSARTAHSQPRP